MPSARAEIFITDIIGGFHGNTEVAELRAKKQMAAEYERQLADAKAAPPANCQMEQVLNQAQQEAIRKSLETQQDVANWADLACFGSVLVTPLFGNTKDARDVRDGMQQGCAAAAAIPAKHRAGAGESRPSGQRRCFTEHTGNRRRVITDHPERDAQPLKSGAGVAPAPDQTARRTAHHPLH
jgi:hypothetical protein